jgi:chromosome segregation ATPase
MPDETGASPRLNVLGLIAVGGLVILTIAHFRALNTLHDVQAKLAAIQADQAKVRDALNAEVAGEMAKMREAAAADEAARQKALESMRTEVAKAQRQVHGVASRVKQDALKSVADLATRVSANEQQLQQSQQSAAQIATEVSGVKQAQSSTQSNVAAVTTDVREVRADVANTRTQLDRTVADLRRVTGDMGVLSGLIATNQKEIDALRQLGDRNYTQFTLKKGKEPVQVAGVSVLLKKADPGRNRYTVELRADDAKIEKRDRTSNEPVQFYVGRNRQPHELVVNQVQKDQVVGYIATPKVVAARP